MTISVRAEAPAERIVLREEDEAECRAAGMSGDAAVRMSAGESNEAFFVYLNDKLAACWGWSSESLFSYRCQAWLLTTNEVTYHPMRFTRSSQRVLGYLFNRFEEVEVMTHHDYVTARRWLAWLGFEPIAIRDKWIWMLAKKESARWVS